MSEPIFDWVSYKAGFLGATVFTCLKLSFNRWKTGNSLSILPFCVQIFWAATILTWEIYWFYLVNKELELVLMILTLNIALDTITKLLLLYYVCYRLIVLLKIENSNTRFTWFLAIGVCACIVVFAEIMFLVPAYNPQVPQMLGNILYMLADVAISIAEITVIIKYISYKFKSSTFSEILASIKDCGLMESFAITVVMAIISGILLAIISIIDPDWHFYYISSAFRYNVSCKLALVFVEKTVSYGSRKNDETNNKSKKQNHLSTNLDRPVGPYSFAVNAL